MTRYLVNHDKELIAYEVRPARKRRAGMGLYVYPDGRVHVTAPPRADLKKIHQHVQNNVAWISKQLEKFKRESPQKRHFTYHAGEVHLYLGKGYPLYYEPARELFNSVKLHSDALVICLSNNATANNPDEMRELVDEWYVQQAQEIFVRRLQHFANILPWVKQMPIWRHSPMKSQWGSCSARNVIALNTQLVKCSLACIDSVIVHELCHFKHRNHGKRFYALLERYIPEWRELKRELNDQTRQVLSP